MAVKITIIGMGQIGASIGLALANHKELVYRIGHDRDYQVARLAEKMGVVDRISHNLPSSVKDSDIVLLALPADQIYDTLELIASELKEDAVVMDTAPVKETTVQWVQELLPAGRHYVGLTPVINPVYLYNREKGIESAQAELFHSGLIVIVAPTRTPSEAIKLASDLTRLLGSMPLFADPVEIDSLMASTHILPQLMAVALLNMTVDQPGWQEARKIAGRGYAQVTAPVGEMDDPAALCSAALYGRDNVLRVLGSLIAALQSIRLDLQEDDREALTERMERAYSGRERWWKERQRADWAGEELPQSDEPARSSSVFGNLLAFGSRRKGKS
jgi:prephenate dehydrogenase